MARQKPVWYRRNVAPVPRAGALPAKENAPERVVVEAEVSKSEPAAPKYAAMALPPERAMRQDNFQWFAYGVVGAFLVAQILLLSWLDILG